jgi:hypothetical protein
MTPSMQTTRSVHTPRRLSIGPQQENSTPGEQSKSQSQSRLTTPARRALMCMGRWLVWLRVLYAAWRI